MRCISHSESRLHGSPICLIQRQAPNNNVTAIEPRARLTNPLGEVYPITAMEDSLEDPGRQFLATPSSVKNIRKSLISAIDEAVMCLLRASRTLSVQEPQLQYTLPFAETHRRNGCRSPFFSRVLSHVYGTTTERQLADVLTRNAGSMLDLGQLLRVTLGAVISMWVFNKDHDEILEDPTERNKTATEKEFEQCKSLLGKFDATIGDRSQTSSTPR